MHYLGTGHVATGIEIIGTTKCIESDGNQHDTQNDNTNALDQVGVIGGRQSTCHAVK